MSIIRENIIIEKCKDIITKYNNGGLSLDDVLTEVNADGLNFHEAACVYNVVKHYITGANSWGIVESETHERNMIYKLSEAINYHGRHDYYRQFTCVDNNEEGNRNTFDICLKKIKKGYTKELVDEMKTWEESDTNPYAYFDVITGNANNDGERVVYDDFTWILTASNTGMTLFKNVNHLLNSSKG